MKHVIFYSLLILFFTTASCEGPAGSQGEVGPQGPKGETGATGATGASGKDGKDGKDGVGSVARYYDFESTWTGSTSSPTTNYKIPNFDASKEYPLLYVNIDGLLYKPLPIPDAAVISKSGAANIVDLEYTFTSLGTLNISEWRYKENGLKTYGFRVIVAPMIKGQVIDPFMSYSEAKSKFGL